MKATGAKVRLFVWITQPCMESLKGSMTGTSNISSVLQRNVKLLGYPISEGNLSPYPDRVKPLLKMPTLVSSEIYELCELSVLLMFMSCFASQSKRVKFGAYFFDVCCAN